MMWTLWFTTKAAAQAPLLLLLLGIVWGGEWRGDLSINTRAFVIYCARDTCVQSGDLLGMACSITFVSCNNSHSMKKKKKGKEKVNLYRY